MWILMPRARNSSAESSTPEKPESVSAAKNTHDRDIALTFVIWGVIVWVVFYYVFQYYFDVFLNGYPGNFTAEFGAPFMATGVAAGFYTISMLLYPVFKKGTSSIGGDDFR